MYSLSSVSTDIEFTPAMIGLKGKIPKEECLLDEAQLAQSLKKDTEISPMEIIDGQPTSAVESQSAEANSAINIETEITRENDFIVFTLSLGATPDQLSAVDDSLNKVCSSSANSENRAVSEKDFDEVTWSSTDDIKLQQGLVENESCLGEWKNSDSIDKSSGDVLVKEEEKIPSEVMASVAEDFSLDVQGPCISYSPREYSNDLRLSLSSSLTKEVSNSDDVLAFAASGKQYFPDIFQVTDNIDIQVLRRIVSTLNETSIERHCSLLGADKKTGDTPATNSKLLMVGSSNEDIEKDISNRLSANKEDETNQESTSNAEDPDLSQTEDFGCLEETASISKSPLLDKEVTETLCEDTISVLVTAQKDAILERKEETPSCCRNLDQPNNTQITEVKDDSYETPLHLCKYRCTLHYYPQVLAITAANNLILKLLLKYCVELTSNRNWGICKGIK